MQKLLFMLEETFPVEKDQIVKDVENEIQKYLYKKYLLKKWNYKR